MTVLSIQVAIPSDGSTVVLGGRDADSIYGDEVTIRNTGSVTVLVGGDPTGTDNFYPIEAGEVWCTTTGGSDYIYAQVANDGTAGELTAIKTR